MFPIDFVEIPHGLFQENIGKQGESFMNRVKFLAVLLFLVAMVPGFVGAQQSSNENPTTAEGKSGGGIHGTVIGGGKPIVGATVRLLEFDRRARTDEHGEFLFSNIPNGTYTIFLHVAGYASGD